MKISTLHLQHVDRHLNAECAVTAPDVDLSKLANIEPNDAPPKDSKLRTYLTQHDVGPDQLPKLKPKSLGPFAAALLDYLEGWYDAAAGSSPNDAAALADRDLRELDDWLADNGVRACLFEQAQQQIHNLAIGKAAADNAWDDALSKILDALGTGRIVATARKNGKDDPKPVPADYWSRLTFDDREFKGRGLQACAYFKTDPRGDCWSDLRFNSKSVVAVWPAKTELQVASLPEARTTEVGLKAKVSNATNVGKRPRIKDYLALHYTSGVPDPAHCPRKTLRSNLLNWDSDLAPLDEATLKLAIDEFNANLGNRGR